MIDWDPTRRPTLQQLGEEFWKLLYLTVSQSPVCNWTAMRMSWMKTDLLKSENLISTDMASVNQTLNQVPPRWDHVLFQGVPHSHNLKTLNRAKQVALARQNLLGASHPHTIHSRVRLAWTSFYLPSSDINIAAEQFKILSELSVPEEATSREIASYYAGLGWSEYVLQNFDDSIKIFEKAIGIQQQSSDLDQSLYAIGLAKVQLEKALCEAKSFSRKRKRSEVALTRTSAEQALHQMHISFNCQRLFSLRLGQENPEVAETMKSCLLNPRFHQEI